MPDATTTPWPDAGWFNTPCGRSVRLDATLPLRGLDVRHSGYHDTLLAVRLLRSTVMWRYRPEAGGVDAWESVVSAQTSLLDSDATLKVVSECDAAEIVAGGAAGWTRTTGGTLPATTTAVLMRRPTTSVLVAVHPADLRRIDVSIRDSVARIDCVLFASAIEKGVLLRGRVLAAVGPRDLDESWASTLLAAFVASPPPLTT